MTVKDRKALRDAHPDSWIAVDAGDTLEGELVDIDASWSDVRNDGSYYPLLTVKTIDGSELKVHCFGAVLFNEIEKRRPEIGDHIVITYLGTGEVKTKGQNPPELYRVRLPGKAGSAERAYAKMFGAEKDGVGGTDPGDDPDVPIAQDELPF